MPGVQAAEVQVCAQPREVPARHRAAEAEEPVQQPSLVHELHTAWVQAQRPRVALRFGAALQDARTYACQRKFAGQHEPGRAEGGLTAKIHLAADGGCRPLAVLITPGQWGDAPQMIPVLQRVRVSRPGGGHPRTRPDHVSGDMAYSSIRNPRYLRRRQTKHTIPEPKNQRVNRQRLGGRGGRLTGFDRSLSRRRNEVERTVNALKASRAVATRYDERAHVFHGTVTLAAIRLWLRS